MSSPVWRSRRRGERPVIYGRERERAQLRELLDDAIEGHGSLVLISGEAGIGKTTLVGDLILRAEECGCLILTGGCYDLTTTPPYGPWIEMLQAYQPGEDGPALPAWLGNPEELERVGSQARLFDEMWSFFNSVAAYQPLVVVLEDLHWSDAASLDALRYLARQLSGASWLLVATYRDDEITRRHQLSRMLPAIVRESSAARLALATLDDAAVREMIVGRYELSPADLKRLSDHISDLTEGNSLYIIELLQTLEDVGSLQVDAGRAEIGSLDRVVVPPLIGQLIEERLGRLDPESVRLLEVAAIIGHEFDYDIWRVVSEADDDLLIDTLDTALRRRILEETHQEGQYRFTHALIREALYERQIWPRRRQQHRKIAEVLEEQSPPVSDIVAYHYEHAGDDRAVGWLIEAGHEAKRAFAWIVAAERYEAAAKRLEFSPDSGDQRARLLADIAGLLRFEDIDRALQFAEEAVAHARHIADQEFTATSLLLRGQLRSFQGDNSGAMEDMAEGITILDALGGIEPVDHLGLPIRGFYGNLLSNAGHFQESLAFLEPYFGADKSRIRSFGNALGRTLAMLGRPDEARQMLTEMYALADSESHPLDSMSAAGTELTFVALPYFFDDAGYCREVSSRYLKAAAASTGLAPALAYAEFPPEDSALVFNSLNWTSWHRWLEVLADMAYSFWGQYARFLLGVLARHQGDRQSALRHVEVGLPPRYRAMPGSSPSFPAATMVQGLAADLALDVQDIGEARSWLEAHDRWMAWSGAVLGLAEGQLGWARYHRIAGDLDKAHEHAERAYDYASSPRQPLALIAADRFLGQLDVDEEKFDSADERLAASLALAERCEAPFEQALTLVVIAERAAKLGEVDEARRLIARLREVCEPLGAKPTLERVDEIEAILPRTRRSSEEHPFGLTVREVEVLRLIAMGRTDAEAAEDLFISPRTVSQHLRNVYNKLSVSNRAEAAAKAVEHGVA